MLAGQLQEITTRRQLQPGDDAAIAELHRRVYQPEYGMNDEFVARVAEGARRAIARGWPRTGGAVWLVERAGEPELAGSLALTDEGDRRGQVRWFVLVPELRGQGLGRALLEQLLASARAAGMRRLELETFSALTSAAHLYREAGFRAVWERERTDWGSPITYQHYELELS